MLLKGLHEVDQVLCWVQAEILQREREGGRDMTRMQQLWCSRTHQVQILVGHERQVVSGSCAMQPGALGSS